MKTYRVTLTIEVDTEALAGHDGDVQAPPNDVAEWYGGDLAAAVDEGIAEIVHEPIELEEVTE